MIINADLKQIEVVMFAHECQDETLIQLLINGQDIHRYVGSYIYDKEEKDITDLERKDIKAAVFGIIYGNGALKLSETTGRSIDWCSNFIKLFYELFPQAKEYHNRVLNTVNKTGQLKLWDNVTLKFPKYPVKYDWQKARGITESYNPPDIKNWPIQHLAGLINSILVGQFYREYAIHKSDKYLLINTVHDSLMIDCKEEFIDECIEDLYKVLDNIPNLVLQYWNVLIEVLIKIDISLGQSWYEV